jgi:steroid delta-isomerase-like uncharacterized protein
VRQDKAEFEPSATTTSEPENRMIREYKKPIIPSNHGGVAKADLELLGRHLAAENSQDMTGTLATLAEDCVFDDRALGIKYYGKEGARRYYESWWGAFDIVTQSDRRYFTSEGSVIAEARYEGVHRGEFLGISATNRRIEIGLAVIITFSGGLMSGERFYWNVASLLTQLGMDSIPEQARTAMAAREGAH